MILRPPSSQRFSVEGFMRESLHRVIVWLGPVSAAVNGQTEVVGPREVLRQLHVSPADADLFMRKIAACVALLLAAQAVFGMASDRRLWRGLARVAGIGSSLDRNEVVTQAGRPAPFGTCRFRIAGSRAWADVGRLGLAGAPWSICLPMHPVASRGAVACLPTAIRMVR